jgi:hypothetical protein
MTLNLTYDELAERLGTTRNAARVLAQRRKWHRSTSQDEGLPSDWGSGRRGQL